MDGLVEKSSFPFHRSEYLCCESVNAAITHFFCRKCCIYVLFCQECRDYALFDVEFYAEFLEEILRNTQNFGRNSAEKIGHWSLCFWLLSNFLLRSPLQYTWCTAALVVWGSPSPTPCSTPRPGSPPTSLPQSPSTTGCFSP